MKRLRFEVAGTVRPGVWDEGTERIHTEGGGTYAPEEVRWLPPIVPRTVVGCVLNYADHAEELGLERPKEPTLFLKPLSSLSGHLEPIVYPRGAEYMHYEVELAVVIGRRARNLTVDDAMDHVGGYTIANDVTVRDFVTNTFRPPVKAKGFDSFGPLGPWVVDRDDIPDPYDLGLRAFVNGELRQEGRTSDLQFRIPELLVFVTAFMTLEEGDVLLTGTPKGLSHIRPGDHVRLEIDGIGALENPVVEATS